MEVALSNADNRDYWIDRLRASFPLGVLAQNQWIQSKGGAPNLRDIDHAPTPLAPELQEKGRGTGNENTTGDVEQNGAFQNLRALPERLLPDFEEQVVDVPHPA